MKQKTICVLIFSFLIFTAGPGTAAAEEINKNFHQSFNVKEGDSLYLKFGDGDVKIIPWDKDIVDVKVLYRADIETIGIRMGNKQEFNVEFRQAMNTVYVIGKEPSYSTIGFHNERIYEYIYEIHSPGYITLDLEGDDGDVEIENWEADIECRIDDGDINLKNITGRKISIWGEDGITEIEKFKGELSIELDDGDVRLLDCNMERCFIEGEDGDVRINQAKGSFDIFLDDGDVIMEKITAKRLNIRTEDGDITADLLSGETLDSDIITDDGNVRINLERGLSVSFHAQADDADYIHLDLVEIQEYREDEEVKSGIINSGNGRLRVRTVDGKISIVEK